MARSRWFWLLFIMAFPASAEILFQQAYVSLLPPGVPNTAGYFTVVNQGEQTRTITSFECDCATHSQLHRTENVNGMVSMQAVDRLPLLPGKTVHLTPGGLHLMLMGLLKPLLAHQQVTLTAHFQNGQSQSFTAKVLPPISTPVMQH